MSKFNQTRRSVCSKARLGCGWAAILKHNPRTASEKNELFKSMNLKRAVYRPFGRLDNLKVYAIANVSFQLRESRTMAFSILSTFRAEFSRENNLKFVII